MMLYAIAISGMVTTQDVSLNDDFGDQLGCVKVAEELRKSDKIADAFCLIADPDKEKTLKIGRYDKDAEAADGKTTN